MYVSTLVSKPTLWAGKVYRVCYSGKNICGHKSQGVIGGRMPRTISAYSSPSSMALEKYDHKHSKSCEIRPKTKLHPLAENSHSDFNDNMPLS